MLFRAPGESTSLSPLSDPTTLHALLNGNQMFSFEWETKKNDADHNTMVLRCACQCVKRLHEPCDYTLEHEGQEVRRSACILDLLRNLSVPEPHWCRVWPEHVRFRYIGEQPWSQDLNEGDLFIARGHTPLQARRVNNVGIIPVRSLYDGWLVEYERGVHSQWMLDLEDSPPVPLSFVDTLTTPGEHYEHRHIAHQLGHDVDKSLW